MPFAELGSRHILLLRNPYESIISIYNHLEFDNEQDTLRTLKAKLATKEFRDFAKTELR